MPPLPTHRKPLTTKQSRETNSIKTNSIFFTEVAPNFPNSIYLEWEVVDPGLYEGKFPVYEFEVFRSENPTGPFTLVTSSPVTSIFYLDEEIDSFSISRTYYYQVKATSTNLTTPRVLTSPATSYLADIRGLQRRRFLEHQKIKRDRRIQLFLVNAEMYILKRKSTGERCPDCYDEATRQVLKNKCETCYGTSFVGGYYNPIRILAEHGVEQGQKTITPHGYSEATIFTVTMQDTPRINRDDLVFEPNHRRYYKVISTQFTTLNRSRSTQNLTVSELARDGIEYQIIIDPSTLTDLYKRVEINDVINSPIYTVTPLVD